MSWTLAAEATAGASALASWPLAAIGASGVVAGALLTGWLADRRERRARREESQRAALYELQEVAFALRLALQSYGAGPPTAKTTRKVDEKTGRLAVVQQRVLSAAVRDQVAAWVPLAQRYFTGDEDVTLPQEEGAYDALQEAVGAELRRLGATRRLRIWRGGRRPGPQPDGR